jgi:hypothetical protein
MPIAGITEKWPIRKADDIYLHFQYLNSRRGPGPHPQKTITYLLDNAPSNAVFALLPTYLLGFRVFPLLPTYLLDPDLICTAFDSA